MERKCSTPGRTDDLTSHSSDEADVDIDNSHCPKSKSKLFNAPKRPKTAYMIFLEKSKATYFDKYPKATFNEYQKHAGQLWRSFTQDEKMVRLTILSQIHTHTTKCSKLTINYTNSPGYRAKLNLEKISFEKYKISRLPSG